jgi:hypothetical protein
MLFACNRGFPRYHEPQNHRPPNEAGRAYCPELTEERLP